MGWASLSSVKKGGMGENMPSVDVTRITVRKENLWGWKIWTLVPLKRPLPLYYTMGGACTSPCEHSPPHEDWQGDVGEGSQCGRKRCSVLDEAPCSLRPTTLVWGRHTLLSDSLSLQDAVLTLLRPFPSLNTPFMEPLFGLWLSFGLVPKPSHGPPGLQPIPENPPQQTRLLFQRHLNPRFISSLGICSWDGHLPRPLQTALVGKCTHFCPSAPTHQVSGMLALWKSESTPWVR